MADFSIDYDLYCVNCSNGGPVQVQQNVATAFTGDFDAGSGTPSGVNAIISDGSVVAGTLPTASTYSFNHTFTETGVYKVTLQFTFADTPGLSECELEIEVIA